MRILGIDPGLASTGAAVIEAGSASGPWRLVDAHEVRTGSKSPMPERLQEINALVREMIDRHGPDAMAVESLFFAKNVRSAVLMAHGRGAAILAAADCSVPVFEYSPLEIKQSVVGRGRATKEQVMQMVAVILKLAEGPASDHQADAMATALAHAFRTRTAVSRARAGAAGGEESPAKQLLAKRRPARRRRR